jgi:hypothetical protein
MKRIGNRYLAIILNWKEHFSSRNVFVNSEFIEKLWESMLRWAAAVIEAKGWYTNINRMKL